MLQLFWHHCLWTWERRGEIMALSDRQLTEICPPVVWRLWSLEHGGDVWGNTWLQMLLWPHKYFLVLHILKLSRRFDLWWTVSWWTFGGAETVLFPPCWGDDYVNTLTGDFLWRSSFSNIDTLWITKPLHLLYKKPPNVRKMYSKFHKEWIKNRYFNNIITKDISIRSHCISLKSIKLHF